MKEENTGERNFIVYIGKNNVGSKYEGGNGYYRSNDIPGLAKEDELAEYLINTLVELLADIESSYNPNEPNSRPIIARFNIGKKNKNDGYGFPLEQLLKIYARAEGVPITFEYLPKLK